MSQLVPALPIVNEVKTSSGPDLNQRPMDACISSTVHRSTNWATRGWWRSAETVFAGPGRCSGSAPLWAWSLSLRCTALRYYSSISGSHGQENRPSPPQPPSGSSVGRAVDCRGNTGIHRSLVQIWPWGLLIGITGKQRSKTSVMY